MKKIKKNVKDGFRTMEKQSFTDYSDVEMEIVTFTQQGNSLAFFALTFIPFRSEMGPRI
jgi:hypothetical protein